MAKENSNNKIIKIFDEFLDEAENEVMFTTTSCSIDQHLDQLIVNYSVQKEDERCFKKMGNYHNNNYNYNNKSDDVVVYIYIYVILDQDLVRR